MMPLNPTPSDVTGTAPDAAARIARWQAPVDGRFQQQLDLVDAAGSRNKPASEEKAKEAAQDLVSMALFLPLLKQARQDPFRTELFHGGQGEEAFAARFDEQIASRLAERSNLPLVDAIAQKFLGTANAASRRTGVDIHA